MKHEGRSLMGWRCIMLEEAGCLHCVEGTMNALQYCKILTEFFLGTLDDLKVSCNNIIFQQDNDLKYTSKQAQK